MCIQQGRINQLPAAEVRRAAPSRPQRRHQTRSPCPPASCFPPERQRWVREWRLASGIATLRRVHIDCTCHWQLAGAACSGSWQRTARWITAPQRFWTTTSLGCAEGVWKVRSFFLLLWLLISVGLPLVSRGGRMFMSGYREKSLLGHFHDNRYQTTVTFLWPLWPRSSGPFRCSIK